MLRSLNVLILEDDLETLETIFGALKVIEREKMTEFVTTQYSTYTEVESMVNDLPEHSFDLILLDRDCKATGSFHVFDIEKFGADKTISISSVPEWNRQARERGVRRVVMKDLLNLHVFSEELMREINSFLSVTKES